MRYLIALSPFVLATPAGAQQFEINWYTIDCGGGTSSGGAFELSGTIGQHDAGEAMTGGQFTVVGGFWAGAGAGSCYPDCDGTGALDIFDFICFQDAFVQMDSYGDCDGSGSFDIFDFICFQDAFVIGCP